MSPTACASRSRGRRSSIAARMRRGMAVHHARQLRPGHVGGRSTAHELERLDRALADSPAHAMVCLHHHPVAMGSRWLDTVGLANADDFWRVIDAHASRPSRRLGPRASGIRGQARQRAAVRDAVDLRAILAEKRPLCRRHRVHPPTGLSRCTPTDASTARSAGSNRSPAPSGHRALISRRVRRLPQPPAREARRAILCVRGCAGL